MVGSPQSDLIIGGDGNDILEGKDGDDTLYGWVGDDWLYGGGGNDTLVGGDGHDTLISGAGADTVYGDAGADNIKGGRGRDTLSGGADADTFFFGTSDVVTTVFQGGPFRWERKSFETDRITDFDTTGADADRIEVGSILRFHSGYADAWNPGRSANEAVAQGYIYWLQSGSGAALKTTVYVDLDGGAHLPTPFFNGGPSDLAIAELQGVAANQVNESHFLLW